MNDKNTFQLQQKYPQFAHLFESDFAVTLYLEVLRETGSADEAREAARVANLFAKQLGGGNRISAEHALTA